MARAREVVHCTSYNILHVPKAVQCPPKLVHQASAIQVQRNRLEEKDKDVILPMLDRLAISLVVHAKLQCHKICQHADLPSRSALQPFDQTGCYSCSLAYESLQLKELCSFMCAYTTDIAGLCVYWLCI